MDSFAILLTITCICIDMYSLLQHQQGMITSSRCHSACFTLNGVGDCDICCFKMSCSGMNKIQMYEVKIIYYTCVLICILS